MSRSLDRVVEGPWTRAAAVPVVLLAALVPLGCHETPPPKTAAAAPAVIAPVPPPAAVTLLPVEVTRPYLAATVLIPAADRTVENGVALARTATPLPMDAAAVREMLLAQAGLPAEVAQRLDLASPIGGAVLAAGKGRPFELAFTFTAKSEADVAPLLASLGKVTERRSNAVAVQTSAGTKAWFLPMGRVVVFSDTLESLTRAGALAIEARRAVSDDVSIVVYPDTIAAGMGIDVKTALGTMLDEMEQRSAAEGSPLPPDSLAQLRELAERIADVQVAELALALAEAKGLKFELRLTPRPGTALETMARDVTTLPLDPVLLSRAEPAFALTTTSRDWTLGSLKRQRDRLVKARDEAAASGNKAQAAKAAKSFAPGVELLDAMAAGFVGSAEGVGSFKNVSLDAIYPLRDEAAGARLDKALGAMNKAAFEVMLTTALAGTRVKVKKVNVRGERIGRARVSHWSGSLELPPEVPPGLVKALFGASGWEGYWALLPGNRLAVTFGKDAKARMTAMLAGKTGTATGALQAALEAEPGRSTFTFFDFRDLLALMATIKTEKPLPIALVAGASKTPLPLHGGARGDASGRLMTLDLVLPPALFKGVGSLVQAMMMSNR